MSRVDVVVPCYNYARYLPLCVNSLLEQPGAHVRVLVIDDASTDDTPAVGAGLARLDPRVEFRRHESNRGHIATYNEGLLGWVEAEYCLLLSADDALAPGAMARAASLMDAHPEVVMTHGREIVVRTDGPLPAVREAPDSVPWRIVPGPEFIEHLCAIASNPVSTPSAIVRSDVQRRIGGYNPALPHSGDLEMWMRFAAHGAIGELNATQAFYRRHAGNMVFQYMYLRDVEQRKAAFESLFAEHGGRIPDAARLRALAHARLADSALKRAANAMDDGQWETAAQLMELGAGLQPGLRDSRAWSRLIWKRRLRGLLPLLRGLRSGRRRAAQSRGAEAGEARRG